MNDFLKKILKGNGILPSEVCEQSFKQNFENAVNVEWFNKENQYEAIFYKNDMEYIAIFDAAGTLLEYRQNLTVNHLPLAIKNVAASMGDIMSMVLKNKGNKLEYEILMRKDQQKRFLITLSETGNIIEETEL